MYIISLSHSDTVIKFIYYSKLNKIAPNVKNIKKVLTNT